MEKRFWYTLMAVAAVLGGLWIFASRVPDSKEETAGRGIEAAPRTGFMAPDFTMTTLDGSTVRLSELRGHPVLINFWASWCGPCRSEMPHIQAAHETHSGDGLIVLGVNQRESPTDVARFVEEFNLTFAIPLDSDGAASGSYQARALPTSFFVDADGIIRGTFTGPMSAGHIQSFLEGIMPESAAESEG
jgi:cytochrome c biogenesis protein CcmG/thiol:disulfide interchange protein DsbE